MENSKRHLYLVALLTLITVVCFLLDRVVGCSPIAKKRFLAPPTITEPERPSPAPPAPRDHKTLEYLETEIARDLNGIDPSTREETRYLVTVDQWNISASDEQLASYLKAGSKAANMIAVDASDVHPLEKVADGIYRLNLDEFDLAAADWEVVVAADQLKLESFTATGVVLKQLTRTRQPWLHVSNFNDTVLRNAAVYYRLTGVSANFGQFVRDIGVDFVGDLADLDTVFAGFAGSLLNQTSHRLAIRLDSRDGYFWQTFDPGIQDKDTKNLFKNPGLAQIGTRANFEFLASEVFYTLRNGLMGSALFNAQGQRQDFAPENIVHDFTTNPLSPTIRNAVSCSRCHSGGLIGLTDQIRKSVQGDDTAILLKVYVPQAELNAVVAKDNLRFQKALEELEISASDPDPIALVTDNWLRDQTLEDVAALLFLRPDELKEGINQSVDGRAEAGALLVGGRITHDQLVNVLPKLKRDLRLFQDPL